MTRTCAYCDAPGPLTRDHVWPACFLDRTGRKSAHFSQKAQKVHGADYVVHDVCEECNNTRLSPLDAYFCALYDGYFAELRDFDAEVTFRYDFDSLLRVLLKIAFNSARAGGSDIEPFQAHRRYVIGLEQRQPGVALFLEVVSPSIVADSEEIDGTRVVMPQMYRSAITKLMSSAGEQVLTRIVAINSFYFHLILCPPSVSLDLFREACADLARLLEGVMRLHSDEDTLTLTSSPQDGLRSIRPHIEAHHEQYEEFFRRRRVERSEEEGSA